jgi:hypothetical protein
MREHQTWKSRACTLLNVRTVNRAHASPRWINLDVFVFLFFIKISLGFATTFTPTFYYYSLLLLCTKPAKCGKGWRESTGFHIVILDGNINPAPTPGHPPSQPLQPEIRLRRSGARACKQVCGVLSLFFFFWSSSCWPACLLQSFSHCSTFLSASVLSRWLWKSRISTIRAILTINIPACIFKKIKHGGYVDWLTDTQIRTYRHTDTYIQTHRYVHTDTQIRTYRHTDTYIPVRILDETVCTHVRRVSDRCVMFRHMRTPSAAVYISTCIIIDNNDKNKNKNVLSYNENDNDYHHNKIIGMYVSVCL